VFACPRDNGANALQRVFREGSPSGAGRNANHAISEFPRYIASAKAEARPRREFGWSRGCNVTVAPHMTLRPLSSRQAEAMGDDPAPCG
jgi:hypothetical protein